MLGLLTDVLKGPQQLLATQSFIREDIGLMNKIIHEIVNERIERWTSIMQTYSHVHCIDWSTSSCMFIRLLLRHNGAPCFLMQLTSKNTDINDCEVPTVGVLPP